MPHVSTGDWIQSAEELLHQAFPRGVFNTSTAVALAAGILGFLITVMIVVRAQGLPHLSWPRAIGSGAVAVFVLIAGMTAGRLLLLPHVHAPEMREWASSAAGLVAMLIVAIPIQMVLHRGNFIQSVISLALSALAGGALYLLALYAMDAVSGERVEFRRIRQRTGDMDQFIRGTSSGEEKQ